MIDLTKTVEMAAVAKQFLDKIAKSKKQVLIVCTKSHISPLATEIAKKHGLFYVNKRWLGGTLTNWNTVKLRIQKMKQLASDIENKKEQLTKKELKAKLDQLELLRSNFAGIESMQSLPDAVIILDGVRDRHAVNEALKVHIPVVLLVDSNTKSTGVDYAIPVNDDSLQAVTMILDYLVAEFN